MDLGEAVQISGARGKGKACSGRSECAYREMLTSIRRADLAEFLVDELMEGRFHGQAVYVVN